MESGIYIITCTKNKKIYIGSAVNLKKRWKRHISELRSGKHHNIKLQNAFNLYGENRFRFDVFEYVDKNKLSIRENEVLKLLQPFRSKGFNISEEYRGSNFKNNPNKKEIGEKISNSKIGKNLSEAHKKSISSTLKSFFSANPIITKGKTLEEIYGKKKASSIRKKISKNNKTKTGSGNPFFGKTHTDTIKQNLSKLKTGKYFGNQNTKIIIDGIEYRSFGFAAKVLGTYPATIRQRCLSNLEQWSNYKLKNE